MAETRHVVKTSSVIGQRRQVRVSTNQSQREEGGTRRNTLGEKKQRGRRWLLATLRLLCYPQAKHIEVKSSLKHAIEPCGNPVITSGASSSCYSPSTDGQITVFALGPAVSPFKRPGFSVKVRLTLASCRGENTPAMLPCGCATWLLFFLA